MSTQQQGIHIKSTTIGMAVGIITIIGALFAVFDKVTSYEVRLDRVEYNEMLRSKELMTLAQEVKFLNVKITDLTIELREFRAINDAARNK